MVHPLLSATIKRAAGGPPHATIVLIHGAGHSAAIWGPCYDIVREQRKDVDWLAVDLPGHGSSAKLEGEEIWSVEHILERLETFLNENIIPNVPIIIVGHSLGAAIGIRLAGTASEWGEHLYGLIILDCAESLAMECLSRMGTFAEEMDAARFVTQEEAVEWSLKRTHVDVINANRTVHDTLVPTEDGRLEFSPKLVPSMEYWRSWFKGIDSMFLTSRCPVRILGWAGPVDALGKTLTVGHMQGKFELRPVKKSGHLIHLDATEDVSDILLSAVARINNLLDIQKLNA